MNAFYFDLFLSVITYMILLLLIFTKFNIRHPHQQKKDQDEDGGLLFDIDTVPTLNLPPGVTLPESPRIPKKHKEFV